MKKSSILILMALWLLIGGRAEAAGVFSDVKSYLENGQKFYQVDVFLDTGGQSLNVLEGEMLYAEEDLNLEKIENGGSIVNFWVEEPEKKSSGKIVFSGGMPGGYSGEKGFLFLAVFSAKKELSSARTEISFQNVEAFLNDGKGTEEKMADAEKILELEKIETTDAPAEDVKAPEIFAPYVTQDPALEGGKWVVLFGARDKGEGISHYEVLESEEKHDLEEIMNSSGDGWVEVKSGGVYVLRNQDLGNYVYVRAVDKSGNSRIAAVVPSDGQGREGLDFAVLSVIIILVVVGVVALLEVFVFRRKKLKLQSEYGKILE